VNRILIVDADARTRLQCLERLAREGYEVRTAAGPARALQVVEEFAPDLTIVEPFLPEGSDIDLVERLLRWNRALRIVIHTEHPSLRCDFRCWAADAFVEKSGDLEPLVETVRALLNVPAAEALTAG
jgi:DNA-binding NtrC family response regulator